MFSRIAYQFVRGAHSLKSWFSARLTGPGRLVVGGIFASAVVGLDTKQTLAYQAFTFLASVFLISMIWAKLSRPHALARRVLPRFGTVGEPLEYRVLLRSESPRARCHVQLFERIPYGSTVSEETIRESDPDRRKKARLKKKPAVDFRIPTFGGTTSFQGRIRRVPRLDPDTELEIRMEILPLRRGRLRLETLVIAGLDPFGLCRSMKEVNLPQSVLILPKRYNVGQIRLTGARRYQPGGVAFASSVGDSQEFVSMREYQAGDPMRRIHWRSWAKRGKPIVKELQEEFFVRHALVLDTFHKDPYSEIFEEAVSIAASLVCAIETRESLLDLMFVGPEAYSFTTGRGLAQEDKMLEILASVRPCPDKPFTSLSDAVFRRDQLISSCICVLLAWDEQRRDFIRRLKESGLPLRVLLVVDAGGAGRIDPGPMSDRPEHFRCLEVGKVPRELSSL